MKLRSVLAVMMLSVISVPAYALDWQGYQGLKPDRIFKAPEVAERLEYQIGPVVYEMALERLQTTAPAQYMDGYVYGMGCRAHACTVDETFYALGDRQTFVAVVQDGKLRRQVGDLDRLPPSIQAQYRNWFQALPVSE